MIIKIDGVDGCGKTTLCAALAEALRHTGRTVATISEYSSPAVPSIDSNTLTPLPSLRIREFALDPTLDCDDIERQLLLHFLSRRRNRVEIPYLHGRHDVVVVDRSSLSNYAYAHALDVTLSALSAIAATDPPEADHIFWIDTPIPTCLQRLMHRSPDAVEKKGSAYLNRVRDNFATCAAINPAVHTLDGAAPVPELIDHILSIVTAPTTYT
ncbi:dTMP kinase [Nocardia nova]|uniref:dTMP kinase n=1 Tax=Nocardia nova TaxID=37330 RepID=UPI001893D914|nr:AAA family ATPase [Nocardia nova]MBF6150339.1 AAA family ATPase [Nocardia nova]